MSYGPPPKTRYGDEDFIKEDWNPQHPSTDSTSRPPARESNFARPIGNLPPQTQPPIYGGGQPLAMNQGAGIAQNQLTPNAIIEASRSLTQEDILFMRSWRQDSFYYRVLPLTAAASGALYYYNKSKSLAQKPSRFIALSMVCYALGKWSYRDEFKRRLDANSSTTPYMQALRNLVGAKSINHSDNFVSEDYSYDDTTQYDQPMSRPPSPFATNFDTNTTLSNEPSDGVSPTTSYEELRARNRGLIPK